MRNLRYIFQVVFMTMTLTTTYASEGPGNRLVVSNDRIWALSELDWSLRDVTTMFAEVADATSVLAVDCRPAREGHGFGHVGIEVLRNLRHEIVVFDTARGSRSLLVGEHPGFNFREDCLGFFEINPESVEDAFYIAKLDGSEERMVVSGGFFEPYPAVASPRFFYVFRSSDNRTLRVDIRTNGVDEPSFLNRRIVLAVWGDEERLLVEDRATKAADVVDGSGKVIYPLKIEQPYAAVEFSNNGKYVYVSIARVENLAEVYDFAAYDLASGKLNIIRRNFMVARGQVSRSVNAAE